MFYYKILVAACQSRFLYFFNGNGHFINPTRRAGFSIYPVGKESLFFKLTPYVPHYGAGNIRSGALFHARKVCVGVYLAKQWALL